MKTVPKSRLLLLELVADLFIFVLFGYWLDKHGNAGYQNIFIYAAVIMAIGVVNAIITQIYKKKVLGKESAQNAA